MFDDRPAPLPHRGDPLKQRGGVAKANADLYINRQKKDVKNNPDTNRKNPRSTNKALDLIISWRGSVKELECILEKISDWGPFELVGYVPLGEGKEECFYRFLYHGPAASRDHYEWNLKLLLDEHVVWADA